ncbi:MAG: HAD-IIB family hydrolase [Pikeienuella sp.]|uniref:HAD-IIB family hydrolase n=1 Tax=Pikeienuella sp. TaxID=2831957 RepID=UPI003919DD78
MSAPPLSARRFVLATDLDGTFLGGSEEDRRRLYDWIEANRATVGLVFVTGRDPAFISELCGSGRAPWPEFVIGDVGTTVASVHRGLAEPVRPVPELEEEIARRWADGGPRVRAALEGHAGLKLQPTPFRHRVSYDMDPEAFDPRAEAVVAALGYDHLISDDRFFDVLPRGVSKGPTLRRLVVHLGLDERRVLAAGDTLNDLSMLESGLPAVAVGGSEPGLLARVRGLDHVHKAEGRGAAGILEAIRRFGLHPMQEGGAHAL